MSAETLVAIVTAFGVMAGVVYSGFQTLLLRRQTEIANKVAATSEARATIQHLHEILDRFVDEPELAKWFLHGKRFLPTRDDPRVPLIAEQFLDVLGIGLHTTETIPGTFTNVGWRSYTTTVLASSPVMVDLVLQHPDWWDELLSYLPPSNAR